LPANAIYLRNGSWLTYRVRQQAGSYRFGFARKLAGSDGLAVTTAGAAGFARKLADTVGSAFTTAVVVIR
jgi:hypothetical protein